MAGVSRGFGLIWGEFMQTDIDLNREHEKTVELPKKIETGRCANCHIEKKQGAEFIRLWHGPGCVVEYCPECFGLLAMDAWGKC